MTPAKRPSNRATESIRTPPWSAPSRGRYSTSRLEFLAAPRPSSAWKKTIKSKFQRRSQFAGSSSWDNVISTNKSLTVCQQHNNRDLGGERTRDNVPKKNANALSNTCVYQRSDNDIGSKGKKSKGCYFSDHGNWNEIYSVSDVSESSFVCSQLESDSRSRDLFLKNKIQELCKLLDEKNKTIEELEAKVKENVQREEYENTSTTILYTPEEPSTMRKSARVYGRLSIESIGSTRGTFKDLFREVDLKLSEIEAEIIHDTSNFSFEPELFEEDNKKDTDASASRCSNQACQIHIDPVVFAKREVLSTSLVGLHDKQKSVKQDFHADNEDHNIAFTNNCDTVMCQAGGDLELRSYIEALEARMEVTRAENEELKNQLAQMKDGKDVVTDKATPQKQKNLDILSPLPTFESWNQFCNRVREALGGICAENKKGSNQRKKLMLDIYAKHRADCLLRELAFVRDGTPVRRCNNIQDVRGTDDIFIDTIS